MNEFEIKSLQQEANPYPEITNALYSPKTISILKNLYASNESEFTAISTYVYQDIVASTQNQELAKLFEEIGLTEMLHLELLGKAISDFGGDPTFTSGRAMPWNSRFVSYTRNLKRMLEEDILSETKAVAAYTYAATQVDNASLSMLLTRIAEDEMQHKKLLQTALDNLQ